jgi:hypothetical protein
MERKRRGRAVIYTVFTVPPALRERAADPKVWKSWRKKIWKYLGAVHGAVYGYERTDPAGDSEPTLWHPHMNFLWVQRDGFRPFLDVDALRAEWARIIGAKTEVDIWSQYAKDGDAEYRLHLYSYMGRTWPDWVRAVPHGQRLIQLGRVEKAPPKEKPHCEECGSRFRKMKCDTFEEAKAWADRGPEVCRAEVRRRRKEKMEPTAFGWRPSW